MSERESTYAAILFRRTKTTGSVYLNWLSLVSAYGIAFFDSSTDDSNAKEIQIYTHQSQAILFKDIPTNCRKRTTLWPFTTGYCTEAVQQQWAVLQASKMRQQTRLVGPHRGRLLWPREAEKESDCEGQSYCCCWSEREAREREKETEQAGGRPGRLMEGSRLVICNMVYVLDNAFCTQWGTHLCERMCVCECENVCERACEC